MKGDDGGLPDISIKKARNPPKHIPVKIKNGSDSPPKIVIDVAFNSCPTKYILISNYIEVKANLRKYKP